MDDETLVALVNGKGIRWGDVWRSAERLPPDYQDKIDTLFPALLQRAVDLQLLADAARAEGLPQEAEIRREVADFEERLIRERLLERHIAARVTRPALEELYSSYLAERASSVEVTARHIQVDDRETALRVIAALDGGADFAHLARQHSVAGSGAEGGSLGTFLLDRMPPAFAAAVIELAPGRYTREPVQTEFGWHVIQLDDKIDAAIASFDELEPRLRQEATRRVIAELLRDLRANAEIEILPAEAGAGGDGDVSGNTKATGETQ